MKNTIKKISKLIASRMFYLLIGLFLAIAISAVYAAWNSTVSGGDTLTSAAWNEHVNKLIDLDNRIGTEENKSPSYVDCVIVSAAARAVCPAGTFLVEMDRVNCVGACTAKCCKPW